MKKHHIFKTFLVCLTCTLVFSCAKDDYYKDGGLPDPIFNGSIMDYLDSKPREFDSIAQIVRLAGLEEDFRNLEFTFFAPRDEDVKELIGTQPTSGINRSLYMLGRDTIKTLADVDGDIWRKYILRYMFSGKKTLADYPQIDFDLLNIYGGQNYISLGNTVCNIGVVYHDAVSGGASLKYLGYRQLHISYIADITRPTSWFTMEIASSDIQPHNGVVHVLDHTTGLFGYNQYEISEDIVESKR